MTNILPFDSLHSEPFFEQYSIDPTAPYAPTPSKPTRLEIIWKKVCDFIKKAWHTLTSWIPRNPFTLTDRQIHLIEKARKKWKPFDHKVIPLASKKTPSKLPEIRIEMTKDPVCPDDKPLQELSAFLEEFASNISQAVHDEVIVPKVDGIKSSLDNGLGQAESWGNMVYEFIKAASKFADKFGAFKDPLLIISAPFFFRVLQKYSEEEDIPDFIGKVEEIAGHVVKEFISDGKIEEGQGDQLISYFKQVLQLLQSSNNWLVTSHNPMLLHQLLKDGLHFIRTFSEKVKDRSFNDKIKKIQDQINTSFETDIQEALTLNVKPMTQFLSARLGELLSQAPFQQKFYVLLEQVINQITAHQLATAKQKEQKAAIQSARHDSSEKANSAKQAKIWREAKDHLAMVEDEGGEKPYLEKKFHEAYGKLPICHHLVSRLIEEQDPKEQDHIKSAISEEIIDRILPYLLPPVEVELPDESKIQLHGIARLYEKFEYPENIKTILNTIDEMITEVLAAEGYDNKENFEKYFIAMRKVLIVELLHSKVDTFIKQNLARIFDDLSSKEFLDAKMNEIILPSLVGTLFISWTSTTAATKVKELAPDFHKILQAEEQEPLIQPLKGKLYEMMRTVVQDFDIEGQMPESEFNELVHPFIVEIIEFLYERLTKENPSRSIKEQEVLAALKSYFATPESAPINPIYGDLIQKALFELGGYPSFLIQIAIKGFKKTVNKVASEALFDVSKSYHLAISSLTESLQTTFNTPEKVKDFFFGAEKLKEEVNLDQNFRNIGAIIHDSMTQYALAQAYGTQWIYHRVTLKTEETAKAITKIYNKIFKRHLLNRNLFMICADIVEDGFSQSVKNLSASRKIGHKVKELRKGSTS